MTDFTVPASELTVPSSNLTVDDTLTNYLSSLSPSDQAAVDAATLFAQQNANSGTSGNQNSFTGTTANTTQTNTGLGPRVETSSLNNINNVGGVDVEKYFNDPAYRADIDAYRQTIMGTEKASQLNDVLDYRANFLAGSPGYIDQFASTTSLVGINDLPFSAEDEAIIQQEAAAAAAARAALANQSTAETTRLGLTPSTAAPTPTGLETLVPATETQTQPPQGEQVVMGGGETGGKTCPAPWIKITMAGGGVVNAGDIKPGMLVYTRHETTGEWGNFPVTAVEQGEDTRWAVLFEGGAEFVGTFNHRVMTDKDWTEIRYLQPGDKVVQHEGFAVVKSAAHLDHGPVVKIEIQDAHTYLSEGVLSHNIKMNEGIQQVQLAGDAFQEIDEAAGGGLMGLARGGAAQSFFRKGKFNFHPAQMYAGGGMPVAMAMGGLGTLGGYSDGGRLLKGPGDGVSDSIPATIGRNAQPARLADGEFVIPARIVSELGNGSTDAGARKLYAMMDRIQRTRGKTVGKDRVAVNSRADKNLPA
jgi:hypothetical protein